MDDRELSSPATSALGADGRYVLRRELGRGTMGVVHEAFDSVLGRTVAVKTIELTLDTSAATREEFEQRFFREARVAAKLSHPGIVVCHDVGKDPESAKLFIVFEHLQGRTLAERAAEGPLPWPEAVSIVLRVARAIHHAHAQAVVHRDLKPANIMLVAAFDPAALRPGDDAVIKIMDFGVAKVKGTGVRLTAFGQSFGSPLYMSPEQALGLESDARSDIFSLGSILYTVLLGWPCFGAPNVPQVLARVIEEDAPALSTLVPGLPVALDRIAARAMAKRVEDRYPTAAAMAEDLEDLLAGHAPRHTSPDTLLAHLVLPAGSRPRAEDARLGDLLDSQIDGPHADSENVLATLVDDVPVQPAGGQVDLPAPPRPARARLGLAAMIAAVALSCAAIVAGAVHYWRSTLPSGVPTAAATPSASATVTPLASTPPEALVGAAPVESPAPRREVPDDAPRTPKGERTPGLSAEPSPRIAPRKASAPTAPAGQPPRTRIRLEVEHPLESGRLVAWIDGALAFETSLSATVAKRIVAVKVREGRVDQMLDVGPGPHEVRVEVSWGDKRRVESQVVDVAQGTTGLLRVRVSRVGKGLRLKWTALEP